MDGENPSAVVRPAPVRRRPAVQRFTAASFPAGDAIARSFQIFARHLPVLIPLAALAQAGPGALAYWRMDRVIQTQTPPSAWLNFAATASQWVMSLTFQALVTYAVFQSLRGQPAAWERSISRGLLRLPSALGAGLIVVFGILVPAMLVLGFFGALGLGGLILGGVGATVWAAMLGSSWFVAVPAAVVEGGAARGVARSAFLTYGARWKVLGVWLLMYLLQLVIVVVVEQVVFPQETVLSTWRAEILTEFGITVVFTALQAVTVTVVYHALRKAKEGVDVADLVKVFE